VLELCREALKAPRPLTPQVLQYLLSSHEVAEGEVVSWIEREMPKLESFELELLLSPLFTPDLPTRLGFEALLGEGHLRGEDVGRLVALLAAERLPMTIVHESVRIESPLPDVITDRFVRLLHLDSPLPEEAVGPFGPLAPEVRSLLRDRSWQRPRTRKLIPVLLRAARRAGDDFTESVRFLTDFVRSHRPASAEDCRAFLENVAAAYEEDLERHQSGGRSFFSQELKASHAGKWSLDADVVAEHRRLSAMARVLARVLG
jgi:hypothetical protein